MTDDALRAPMQDPRRWPNVLLSFKYWHKASWGLALLAQELFTAGAPVIDPKAKKIVRARQ